MFCAPMLVDCAYLATSGGSPHYLVAGAVFTVAAILALCEQRRDYWLFLLGLGGTLTWAFSEVAPSFWGLLLRRAVFTTIAIVCWALRPWIVPRRTRSAPIETRWHRAGIAADTIPEHQGARRFLAKALAGLKGWQMPGSISTDKALTHAIAIAQLKAEWVSCPSIRIGR